MWRVVPRCPTNPTHQEGAQCFDQVCFMCGLRPTMYF